MVIEDKGVAHASRKQYITKNRFSKTYRHIIYKTINYLAILMLFTKTTRELSENIKYKIVDF